MFLFCLIKVKEFEFLIFSLVFLISQKDLSAIMNLIFSAMYGIYSYPVHLEKEGLTIDITENNGIYRYVRNCCGEKYECLISSPGEKIHVNPVEPVNLPKYITKYLEIDFERVLVSPESNIMYYLTFPIEIGVFLESKKNLEPLDLFSLQPAKYSLYGDPTNGEIVKYYKSYLRRDLPEVDILKEGVLSITIINSDSTIASVSKLVFDSYGMKVYYNENLVSMVAQMKIYQKNIAETEFLNVPLLVGMEKSAELYTTRNIPAIKRYYLMERGFD
ncbi:hypothetical protein J2128_001163 [Methanomicrobium sp. W14]|uniref:DUF432 domain-containing protein n=1 Tax=Methanomicrobium sp. W14 TaxID=2817839 RepID=UPI001FDA9C09|nr:DUF432 domain-containing protein [Methanomicrobium sp. W14]MBP2133242.1 hypothetical protein [Methanomicrobium sp. W14]